MKKVKYFLMQILLSYCLFNTGYAHAAELKSSLDITSSNQQIIKVSFLQGCNGQVKYKHAGDTAEAMLQKYFNGNEQKAWELNKDYCSVGQGIWNCMNNWPAGRTFCGP